MLFPVETITEVRRLEELTLQRFRLIVQWRFQVNRGSPTLEGCGALPEPMELRLVG